MRLTASAKVVEVTSMLSAAMRQSKSELLRRRTQGSKASRFAGKDGMLLSPLRT